MRKASRASGAVCLRSGCAYPAGIHAWPATYSLYGTASPQPPLWTEKRCPRGQNDLLREPLRKALRAGGVGGHAQTGNYAEMQETVTNMVMQNHREIWVV
ncbi:MAG: hypothetical protein WCG34_01225, partial [Leptolinea sp.]